MQNDWVLLDRRNPTANDTDSSALRTFETYLADAYVLPDSGVFLFRAVDDGLWEIWNGFRASKSDAFRAFRVGTVSANHLHVDDYGLNDERKRFGGITLKSTTVVRKQNYIDKDI